MHKICSKCDRVWDDVKIKNGTRLGAQRWKCMCCGTEAKPREVDDETFAKLATKFEEDSSDTKRSLSTKSLNIRTAEELLEYANVDASIWKVARQKVNTWEVTLSGKSSSTGKNETITNYQVSVWLERKSVKETALEEFIKNIKPYKPKERVKVEHTGYLHEVCLFDHHFGKYAWHEETGNDYDLGIAKDRFMQAIWDMTDHFEKYPPEKILFPIGNDFLHINNMESTTKKGTHQDSDSRLAKIYEVALQCVKEAVEILAEYAPVDMVWVASNHDLETSFYLCKTIEAFYYKDENINVDVGPAPRKYYQWGKVLIGYEHGELKPTDMPRIMADEVPHMWADTRFHEWHVGHYHKKSVMSFTTTDSVGSCMYRRIPSLTGTDYWHYKSGYVGTPKAAQGFVWDKEHGEVCNYTIAVK